MHNVGLILQLSFSLFHHFPFFNGSPMIVGDFIVLADRDLT